MKTHTQQMAYLIVTVILVVGGAAVSYADTVMEATWVSGSHLKDQPGVYGTKGVAHPDNIPGGRDESISWTDSSGNLWLFGGLGYDSIGDRGRLNDLWKYDGANWTWVSGTKVEDQPGVYGTKGVPSSTNIPGGRDGSISWIDSSGNLWLFGGYGHDASGDWGSLNDLWKYDGANWTWVSGTHLKNHPGVYGTKGVAHPDNIPVSRSDSISWIDSSGNFWLFGGEHFTKIGLNYESLYFNDLWKYDGTYWTWVSGTELVDRMGVNGVKGVVHPFNIPGARSGSISWIDSSGNLWLFGGFGVGYSNDTHTPNTKGRLSDLWKYDGTYWTWVSGTTLVNVSSHYGTKGVADSDNRPGGRDSSISWVDSSGNFWLFGGWGYGHISTWNRRLNDLWKYDGVNWTWVSGTILTDQPGVYGTKYIAHPDNIPGGRDGSISWIDSSGNLWLFGGHGYGSAGSSGWLNDLWKFAPPWEASTYLVTPGQSIQAAINAADYGDTVYVTAGTYIENITLKNGVKLIGENSWNTIIDGDASGSVVTASGCTSDTLIKGFRLTGGSGTSDSTNIVGGGLYNYGSSHLRVTDCVFMGNAAGLGGGMYNHESHPQVTNCAFDNNICLLGAGGGMYNLACTFFNITDCTFTGNIAPSGGGIVNAACSIFNITDCSFYDNTAFLGYGGGILNTFCDGCGITACSFTGNNAVEGGGGMCNSLASPMITACSFSNNTAGENGGGIYNDDSNPTIAYCPFSNNTATYNGGGMYNYDSSYPTVTNCSFSGNIADYGGGIYNDDSNPEFTNCLFVGNIADYGGGICNDLSSPTVTNCSFSGNATATYYGDGMFNISTSNPIIINSIFWDINDTISGKDIYNEDSTSTPMIAYSNIADSGGSDSWNSDFGTDFGGNIDADPMFTALGYWDSNGTPGDPSDDWWSNGNYRLLPGSPCIDAGDSTEVSLHPETIDASNKPRVLNDPTVADTGITIMYQPLGIAYAIDMGAYEYQPCFPEIPCDFNCDGQVGMADLSIFAAHWLEGASP